MAFPDAYYAQLAADYRERRDTILRPWPTPGSGSTNPPAPTT